MKNNLYEVTDIPLLQRPQWNEEYAREAQEILAERILEWEGTHYAHHYAHYEDEQEYANELKTLCDILWDCIGLTTYINGYFLCKDLETKWGVTEPNVELVEICDDYFFITSTVLRTHIEAWVKENDLKLVLIEGDIINGKRILRCDHDQYRYLVDDEDERYFYPETYTNRSIKNFMNQ